MKTEKVNWALSLAAVGNKRTARQQNNWRATRSWTDKIIHIW